MAAKNVGNNGSNESDTDDIMPEGFCTLWKKKILLDYAVKVKSRKFKVHKIVLASMSDYFRVMLTGALAESQRDSVEVHGISCSVMDKLIRFMYTNELNLTKNTAADVLAGAMYLQIPTAVKRCTKYIISHLSSTNWFEVLSLFKTYNLTDAQQDVKAFMEKEMTNIVQGIQSDCGELTLHYVQFLVDIWQGPEWDLVLFITKWVEADFVHRKEYLKDLLGHVQYCLIDPTKLTSIRSMDIYKRCRRDMQELVKRGLAYHNLPTHQKVVYNSQEVRGRPALVCFSKNRDAPIGSYFKMTTDVKPVADEALMLPEGVWHVDNETVINNFLVICARIYTAGLDPQHSDQQWYIFDPMTKKWSKMANLARLFHQGSLTNDGTYLYAIGGLLAFPATDVTTTSIDRYDFSTNYWSSFAELRFTGADHSACVLNNKLYVSGGRMHNQDEQATMDCLDLSTQTWAMNPPMLEALSNHTMHIMTVEGEEVICIFNDSFFMDYYSPKSDRWYTSSFTFSKPVPRKDEVGWVWAECNNIYLMDINLKEAFGEKGLAYQVLEYPVSGDEVDVHIRSKYKTAVADPEKVHAKLLRLPFS